MQVFISYLLLFNQITMNINHKEFETCLGKEVSEVNKILTLSFSNIHTSNKQLYFAFLEEDKYFYQQSYKAISLILNNKKKAISLTIHFNQLVNNQFYKNLQAAYGAPNSIQVIEQEKRIAKTSVNDTLFKQELSKNIVTTRKGSLEENPLFVMWKSETISIEILNKYKQSTSELTFKAIDY
ncbi:conserved hypothetical protein [Tenacibaculum sp. 190524A02b]